MSSPQPKTKKIAKPSQEILVQYNQIKGRKIGSIDKSHQWKENA